MKIILVSDVHSNLEALKAISDLIKKMEKDLIIFMGDVIGYGANPNECCEIIRDIADVCLMGNHDACLVDQLDLDWFNETAKRALLWTKEKIKKNNIEWIKSFDWYKKYNDILFSHASPVDMHSFIYVNSYEEAEHIFKEVKERICFVGHSHITTGFYKQTKEIKLFKANEVRFNKGFSYIINVGSAGQPRDGDARCAFGFLDTDSMVFKTIRLDYHFDIAAKKIIDAGLPDIYGYRLLKGV